MLISKNIPKVTLVALSLVLSGCPKSKTETSNSRTDMSSIGASPATTSVLSPAADKSTTTTQTAVNPVPSTKTTVDQNVAPVTKKPGKTTKGEDLAVSSTHVEVIKPSNPDVAVVIVEAPVAQAPAAALSDLVEFPAVILPGAENTVAVGQAAEAILADPQPLQAAASAAESVTAADEATQGEIQTVALQQETKETTTAKAPAVVDGSASANLDSDLGQAIPVKDVKEVVLTPNTKYDLKFVEQSPVAAAEASAAAIDVAQVVTLAAEPAIKAAEQQKDTSIKLTIDTNSNPTGTMYSIAIVLPATGEILGYVNATTGEILKEGQERFHELKSNELLVRGLNEDVELVTFVIQAQNQKGDATSWSEEAAVVAVAEDVLAVDDSTEVAVDDTSAVDPVSVGIDLAVATDKDVQVKIDKGQSSLSNYKVQLKELKAKLEAIRKDLKAKNADRREIQKKLRKYEKDRKKYAKEIESLKNDLDGVQTKIDQLGKQLREIKAQVKALQGKVKDQAAEIKKLKKVQAQMKKAAKGAAKVKKK